MKISQSIFKKNISILEAVNPFLAQRVKQTQPRETDYEMVKGTVSTVKVSGIQLSSRYEPEKEAVVQASSVGSQELVNIYGLGLGYLPEEFLNRKTFKRINVKIMSIELFSLILFLRDQTRWICDPKVFISLAHLDNQVKFPFVAVPPDLLLAKGSTLRIRNVIETIISDNFTRNQFKSNDPSLIERIKKNYIFIEKDKDVDCLKGTEKENNALVIGAGPSLIRYVATLRKIYKQSKRPIFICVATATKVLQEAGIIPDFIVIIDKDTELFHPLIADFSVLEKSHLVYFPLVLPELLGAWKGDRYLAYSEGPIFDNVKQKFPSGTLFSGGSVIHVATDLAIKLGCKKVTFYGADFCYPNNRTHAGHKKGILTNYHDVTPPHEARRSVVNGYGVEVKTLASFITYLVELESYIKEHPEVEFWNSSKLGAKILGTFSVEDLNGK